MATICSSIFFSYCVVILIGQWATCLGRNDVNKGSTEFEKLQTLNVKPEEKGKAKKMEGESGNENDLEVKNRKHCDALRCPTIPHVEACGGAVLYFLNEAECRVM